MPAGFAEKPKSRKSTASRPIRKVLTNAVTGEKRLVAVGHKTAEGEEVYVSGVQGRKQKSSAASKSKKKKPAAKKKQERICRAVALKSDSKSRGMPADFAS